MTWIFNDVFVIDFDYIDANIVYGNTKKYSIKKENKSQQYEDRMLNTMVRECQGVTTS